METIHQYFERRDTPEAGSPVGTVMIKVLEKYPELSHEEARAKAADLLAAAAKSKVYRSAQVLSREELIKRSERFKTAFQRPLNA